ncbi:hypothetical protein [Mesorhizobium sp. ES1-4]|uniref:hypothetical protein n=1 Tax=Mesorhizobium sp. ES1-4 TaxID=2876627 RepID=UPI001CD03932|nr:hypothetical protein [Mesorhizobium sp. ES1-4]MBZ9794324.1 hypothetical protein [Mesorhizobium sp. ES1-4]
MSLLGISVGLAQRRAQMSGVGGGGGGADSVTFNGMAVTFEADDVTYSPDLWLFNGQRVTYQGDGVTLNGE